MEKELFIAEYESISEKIRELENRLSVLRNEYITSNSPFPVGTKVKVSYPSPQDEKDFGAVGIVTGWALNMDDEVVPFLAKVKKDGTAHQTQSVFVANRLHPIFEACE